MKSRQSQVISILSRWLRHFVTPVNQLLGHFRFDSWPDRLPEHLRWLKQRTNYDRAAYRCFVKSSPIQAPSLRWTIDKTLAKTESYDKLYNRDDNEDGITWRNQDLMPLLDFISGLCQSRLVMYYLVKSTSLVDPIANRTLDGFTVWLWIAVARS